MVGYNGTYYWVDYDEIGNPIRYGYGESDSDYMEDGYELTWDGRELVAFRQCSDFDSLTYVSNITYTYNADGIRTSKTVNGVKHEYYLSGSQIVAETWEENGVEHTLIYIYGESGSPIGLKYRNDAYNYDAFDSFFFEKNLQGDIIAIYNEDGERIGSYRYDAWGNHTVAATSGTTAFERQILNNYNPFRYRGYYYDVETKFYYLQSRYYNPEWCRFLNADNYVNANGDIIGFNMYAYCSNNPINCCDPCGTCIHQWNFWDQCDKCGGKTLKSRRKEFSDDWNQFWKDGAEAWEDSKDDFLKIWDQMHNKDGTWSLIDNHRSDPNRVLHEQYFVFDPVENGIGGSFSFGKGTWELEHVDLALLDCFKLTLQASRTGAKAGVSVFNPHVTIGDIEIGFDIGGGVGWDISEWKLGFFYIDFWD